MFNNINIKFVQLLFYQNLNIPVQMTSIADSLKAINSSSNKQDNLYNHIKKVIAQLVITKQTVNQFQNVSAQVKANDKKIQQIDNDQKKKQKLNNQGVFKIRQAYAHVQAYEKKTRDLAGKLNIGTQEQPQQPTSLGYVPDFVQESRAFQKFGIGFGQTESYLIFKSLCRFAQKKNAKQIRLWGKILGRDKDYYIAEGVADTTQQQGQLPADVEPKGTGVNKSLFWVTNQLTGEWTELPVVSPKQIKIARRIKYLFTGDLNRDILTNPDFEGKQAHLLKCQLVRINTTCTIVPKGMFVTNAEDPKEIESPEEYTFPNVTTLADKQNWVYLNPSILQNGRTTIQKPQGLEPEDEQKWMKTATQKDPTQPRLKNIVLDSQNWSIKSHNLAQMYLPYGKNAKSESKGVVGLKNILWPGWLTVSYNGKYQSIYVGYGTKARQNYYPCEPQTVLTQREDRQEFVVNE